MNSINIFKVIKTVTKRIEPFHSELLAQFFIKDVESEGAVLVKRFIELSPLKDMFVSGVLEFTTSNVEIHSEESFQDGKRIDIMVRFVREQLILGVEVKTTDSSTTLGQLGEYYHRLQNKYPDHNIFLIYLTPFNIENTPNDIDIKTIHAVEEYREFEKQYPAVASHVNWESVIGLYPISDTKDIQLKNLYDQHRSYILEDVCNVIKLKNHLFYRERNRELATFLGDEVVDEFFDFVNQRNIDYDDTDDKKYVLHIPTDNKRWQELIESITILLESELLQKNINKADQTQIALINKYRDGKFGDFFSNLFDEISKYSYVWLEGKKRIGIRAAHSSYRSNGVSIVTLDEDSVEIARKR